MSRLLREAIKAEIARQVNEEYLYGIPEFVLQDLTKKYISSIKDQISRYIMISKSEDATQRRESLAAANETLESLEEKINALLEDELHSFIGKV